MKKINLCLAIFFISCSSVNYSLKPQESTVVDQKYPDLNVVSQQELGDTLVSFTYGYTHDSYQITKTYEHSFQNLRQENFANYLLKPGVMEPLGVDTLSGTKVYLAECAYMYVIGRNRIDRKCQIGKDLSGNFLIFPFDKNYTSVLPQLIFKPSDYVIAGRFRTTKQLIYNGKSGNTIKFLYREISQQGTLRSPFTQEVQYDLSEGSEIGFRGMRIEVIEATNTNIKYKVIKHFDNSTIYG